MADSLVDRYWQLPPVARTFATGTFALSICIYTRVISSGLFIFHHSYLWRLPPQIWRIVTSFMITGPDLSILFDTYFLYTYLSHLEARTARFSRKEDLTWYLLFHAGAIMILTYLSGFGSATFIRPMIIAMCYTVTQEQRGMTANFMFINIPAQLTPYAMMLFNLLFPGGVYTLLLELHGLVAAHLFDFLSRTWPDFGGGKNLVPTPAFLTKVLQVAGRARNTVAAAAGMETPEQASGRGTGAARGPLPDSWRTRGPGRRLG